MILNNVCNINNGIDNDAVLKRGRAGGELIGIFGRNFELRR